MSPLDVTWKVMTVAVADYHDEVWQRGKNGGWMPIVAVGARRERRVEKRPEGERPWRPTREELARAYGKKVPDLIAVGLKVLFCGINPGLYSGAVGHHFARPGNRFWPALQAGGFTRGRVISPFEERELLGWGYGITNLVQRATARADELRDEELRAGAKRLEGKVRRYRPGILAVVGVGAYRMAFDRPGAGLGRQEEKIRETVLWVLPNPSGLNAHYQAAELGRLFGELRRAAEGM